MTKEEAYHYIDNLKWLKGYDNTVIGEKTVGEILDEINALLKEQEARVLTLEEVRERKPFHLWVEDLETGAQVFPVAYVGGLYVDSAEDWSVDPDHRNTPEYYGKTWRCWTARPTDEQRKAVAWE